MKKQKVTKHVLRIKSLKDVMNKEYTYTNLDEANKQYTYIRNKWIKLKLENNFLQNKLSMLQKRIKALENKNNNKRVFRSLKRW